MINLNYDKFKLDVSEKYFRDYLRPGPEENKIKFKNKL